MKISAVLLCGLLFICLGSFVLCGDVLVNDSVEGRGNMDNSITMDPDAYSFLQTDTQAQRVQRSGRSVLKRAHAAARRAHAKKHNIGPAASGSTSTLQQTSVSTPSTSSLSVNGQGGSAAAGSASGSLAGVSGSSPSQSGIANSNQANLNGGTAGAVQEPNNVLNTGTSRLHTDRDGHHYIYMVNNNVLTQSLPSATQQIMAAAAAQAIARHIASISAEKQKLSAESAKEEASKNSDDHEENESGSHGSQSSHQSSQSSQSGSSSQGGDRAEQTSKADEQQTKRLMFAFQDPWKNYGSEYQEVSSKRVDKVCVVSGMVAGNSGLVGTLGPDCRPAGGRVVFGLMRGDLSARIDVMSDGRIYVIASGGDGWLSLSGISFTVGVEKEVELLNNWKDFGNGYRPTTITKLDDACILSGFLAGGDWNRPFGRVPQECYPSQRLIFNANNHEAIARVDVLKTGHFAWVAGQNKHGWVSLSGMMWCVADGGINLNPAVGWKNYGGEYRPIRYCMVRNMCILSGIAQNDGDWKTSPKITILPNPCRPARRQVFSVNHNIKEVRIDVLPTGEIVYQSGKAGFPWFSLDGISFIVADLGAVAGSGQSPPLATQSGPVQGSPSPKASFRSRRDRYT